MVLRQTRLIAKLMLATILLVALWSLLFFGPDVEFAAREYGDGRIGSPVPVWQAALLYSTHALLLSIAHEAAWRTRRWRRNVLRAGGVFATSWIGSLTLVLSFQIGDIARALGQSVNQGSLIAFVIGVVLLLRANQLPKSRPAWFNGVALPIFASRADVWRRVHRSSALRLLGIGLVALILATAAPDGIDPVRPLMLLLLAEMVATTLHALWLGARSPEKEII